MTFLTPQQRDEWKDEGALFVCGWDRWGQGDKGIDEEKAEGHVCAGLT